MHPQILGTLLAQSQATFLWVLIYDVIIINSNSGQNLTSEHDITIVPLLIIDWLSLGKAGGDPLAVLDVLDCHIICKDTDISPDFPWTSPEATERSVVNDRAMTTSMIVRSINAGLLTNTFDDGIQKYADDYTYRWLRQIYTHAQQSLLSDCLSALHSFVTESILIDTCQRLRTFPPVAYNSWHSRHIFRNHQYAWSHTGPKLHFK